MNASVDLKMKRVFLRQCFPPARFSLFAKYINKILYSLSCSGIIAGMQKTHEKTSTMRKRRNMVSGDYFANKLHVYLEEELLVSLAFR